MYNYDLALFCFALAGPTWTQSTTVSCSRLALLRTMEMQKSTLWLCLLSLLSMVGKTTWYIYILNYYLSCTLAGGDFQIMMNFTTTNGTGTGEYSVLIKTVDGIPLGQSSVTEPLQPGTYTVDWKVSAAPDPDCDPTQGPCETWQPGNYSVAVGKKV